MKWKDHKDFSTMTEDDAVAEVVEVNIYPSLWAYSAKHGNSRLSGYRAGREFAKAAAEEAIKTMRKGDAK